MFSFIYFLTKLTNQIEENRKKGIKDYSIANNFKYNEKSIKFPSLIKDFALANTRTGTAHSWGVETSGYIDDIEFYIVEHRYTKHSGNKSHVNMETICLLRKPNLEIPDFYIRKEDPLFDGIEKHFGMQDINFAEDPTFSKRFVLQGKNIEGICNFFDSSVRLAFIENHPNSLLPYQYEGKDDKFLVYADYFKDNKDRVIMLEKAIAIFKSFSNKN